MKHENVDREKWEKYKPNGIELNRLA